MAAIVELALALAILGVAALPCWRHSADWGYLPSATAGALLMGVILLVGSDKVADHYAQQNAKVTTVAASATVGR